MRNKRSVVLSILLLGSIFCFANTGGKEKKDDPDMNGFIVEAETGKPIRDVNVTAYNYSKKEKVVTSNANGSFSLTDLKPGIYKFVFEKEGFEKVIREKLILKPKEGYQLTVQMSIQMSQEERLFDLMPSPLRFSTED